MPARSILILGGGVGGLAAAARLAAVGHRITLLEKNGRVGGKLNLREIAHPARPNDRPFRFDTGPSLLTLPLIFADLFHAAGKDVRDYLTIERLDPIARFQWADGRTFSLHQDPAAMEEEVRRFAPGDLAGWQSFRRRGEKIWNLAAEAFLFQSPEQMIRGDGKFNPLAALKLLSIPFRIGMFSTYSRLVDRHIRDPRLREVLYQYATYSGASPFKAPATLAVIPHAELHFGGWYIKGGMYALAAALEKLARDVGVEIVTGASVTQILIDDSHLARSLATGKDVGDSGSVRPVASDRAKWKNAPRVTGVRLEDGTTLAADAVIANSDVVYTYRELIEPQFRPHYNDAKLARLEPGGSGFVLLLGIEGTYPQLAHHTKFMPADYRSDLTAMFDTRTIPDDPCIYVCASTRTDETQAPPGCENLFVLCSAPPLEESRGQARGHALDWSIEGPRYRDRIISTLETRFGLADLSKRIVVERQLTPVDLKSLYNANAGTIYGLSSNSKRAAFLRPPNRDKHIAGLYFAGGATHPGGGLPLVALSGKIAAELCCEDFEK